MFWENNINNYYLIKRFFKKFLSLISIFNYLNNKKEIK